MIGNTNSAAGLQKNPTVHFAGNKKIYKALTWGQATGSNIQRGHKSEIISKIYFPKHKRVSTKVFIKHTNTEKNQVLCRPQPGTDVLPAAAVSPTPCHQPSLGTRTLLALTPRFCLQHT